MILKEGLRKIAHSLQFSQAFELMGVIFSIVKFVPLKQTPIKFVHLN